MHIFDEQKDSQGGKAFETSDTMAPNNIYLTKEKERKNNKLPMKTNSVFC